MHELTMIRAVVAGEVKDAGHAGTDALRAVLVRLFASFDVVRFPSLGVGGPDGTVVYQGAAPVVEQAVVVQRRCKGLPLPLPSRR